MKLGTQTGSLVNHIRSRQVIGQPEPVVGMGATILGWTDRHAATITKIEKVGKRTVITVRRDDTKRIDSNGFSESQTYEYTPNPNGASYMFAQLPSGIWEEVCRNRETGRLKKMKGCSLRIGERESYHDFSF
jgi:hypothetical protein